MDIAHIEVHDGLEESEHQLEVVLQNMRGLDLICLLLAGGHSCAASRKNAVHTLIILGWFRSMASKRD